LNIVGGSIKNFVNIKPMTNINIIKHMSQESQFLHSAHWHTKIDPAKIIIPITITNGMLEG